MAAKKKRERSDAEIARSDASKALLAVCSAVPESHETLAARASAAANIRISPALAMDLLAAKVKSGLLVVDGAMHFSRPPRSKVTVHLRRIGLSMAVCGAEGTLKLTTLTPEVTCRTCRVWLGKYPQARNALSSSGAPAS